MEKKNITVLIVDDQESIQSIVKNILVDLGYSKIMHAMNAISAQTILQGNKIDLILSDWNMPRMSGLELLKYVKSQEQLKSIPFIMITSQADKENIVAAVKEKVDGYIVKPFNAEILDKKIRQALLAAAAK